MLTLSVIKENPEEVIRRLAIKHFDGKEAINRVLELDKIRRASQAELDGKLAELKSPPKSWKSRWCRQKRRLPIFY